MTQVRQCFLDSTGSSLENKTYSKSPAYSWTQLRPMDGKDWKDHHMTSLKSAWAKSTWVRNKSPEVSKMVPDTTSAHGTPNIMEDGLGRIEATSAKHKQGWAKSVNIFYTMYKLKGCGKVHSCLVPRLFFLNWYNYTRANFLRASKRQFA